MDNAFMRHMVCKKNAETNTNKYLIALCPALYALILSPKKRSYWRNISESDSCPHHKYLHKMRFYHLFLRRYNNG
jgi:hypothetical protein